MLGLRQQHELAVLLQVAGLPRSTFYYHAKQEPAAAGAELERQIRDLYHRHRGCYGYRRITLALRQAGHKINHKAVQRRMQAMGLKSLVRVKKYRSYRGEGHVAVPNVLQRQFQAEQPNEKWVTDVTEFNVRGQKLYLSPVMDLYNGEIVAYHMDRRAHFPLVGTMLRKALAKLQGDTPLLHSDQGWQYQMPAYRRMLAKHGLTQSMSRKGNCLDNAAMESFFGILKSEYFHLNRFTSIEQLEQGLRRYIHYYNCHRIKSKLKGLSPVQYRTQPLVA